MFYIFELIKIESFLSGDEYIKLGENLIEIKLRFLIIK